MVVAGLIKGFISVNASIVKWEPLFIHSLKTSQMKKDVSVHKYKLHLSMQGFPGSVVLLHNLFYDFNLNVAIFYCLHILWLFCYKVVSIFYPQCLFLCRYT